MDNSWCDSCIVRILHDVAYSMLWRAWCDVHGVACMVWCAWCGMHGVNRAIGTCIFRIC